MTRNWKRYAIIGLALVTLTMANIACNDTDTDTVTSTPIPLGDDTITETVDGIRTAVDDEQPLGLFGELWDATAFDDD